MSDKLNHAAKPEHEKGVLDAVKEKFMGEYASRDEDDVLKLVPMLFSVVEPAEEIRTALKCLNCRLQKEKRSADVDRLVRSRDDLHMMVREFDHLFSEMRERYGRYEKEGMGRGWGFQDVAMMTTLVASMQRSAANVTLDASKVIGEIYGECEKCFDRDMCKGAYALLIEYIAKSIR
jgi:hypothetical protein